MLSLEQLPECSIRQLISRIVVDVLEGALSGIYSGNVHDSVDLLYLGSQLSMGKLAVHPVACFRQVLLLVRGLAELSV